VEEQMEEENEKIKRRGWRVSPEEKTLRGG